MTFKTKEYIYQIQSVVNENKEIIKLLENKIILITGAGGLIGSYLVDLIMCYNEIYSGRINLIINDKDEAVISQRFESYKNSDQVKFYINDISKDIKLVDKIDYIIHAASNTSPKTYLGDPVGTIEANLIGNYNLLNYAKDNKITKFLFCSSVEVYGNNFDGCDEFDESYSGYVDCNTTRASYPSSKRACESMCNAYKDQFGVNFVIARIGRIYGPNVLPGDTKAPSQFITNGLNGQDIILKSDGNQLYSYCYVADCAMALVYLLVNGEVGEAYNISDSNSICLLKEFAQTIANICNTKLVFDKSVDLQKEGYSKITKAVMNTKKVENLGWKAKFDITNGLKSTIQILKESIK